MSSLYLEHFGLQKPPFKITPDPDFFFTGGRRGDVLSALEHVAATEEGIITVVAEVGSGKTLLARLLLERLGQGVCSVYLSNPVFSRDEILSAIARDLGVSPSENNTESKLAVLQAELLRRHAAGQRVLLVVDEAHAMPSESLEEIRLLSNLETAHHKLLNIVLFGQPELDTLLARVELRQVRDRVIHRFELPALPHEEACAYVDHRLRAAGWSGGALFAPSALAELVKSSGGRARRINLLADKALLAAYAHGAEQVRVEEVKAAVAELDLGGADMAPAAAVVVWNTWQFWAGCAVMGLLAFGAGWWVSASGSPGTTASMKSDTGLSVAAEPAKQAAIVASSTAVTALHGQSAVPPASTVVTAKASGPAQNRSPVSVQKMAVALPAPNAGEIKGLTAASSLALAPYVAQFHKAVQDPSTGGFSVQLASLPRDENVTRYIKSATHLVDSAMIFIQPSVYNGREYISVFYGRYDSMAAAQQAIATLPAALKTNKPVVRTWIKIKEDQLP